ncbi:heme-binding protein [Litoreibacter sp.]|nr:heme-binding protein [Litoreibacter sp.]
MAQHDQIRNMSTRERYIGPAKPGMDVLGPLQSLPGVWHSRARGWNMIALPVAPSLTDGSAAAPFRVLMNQYSETLKFTTVDTKVPNRGIRVEDDGTINDATQFVVTLDYEQKIAQDLAEDFPKTKLAGGPGTDIHHEPGLWLNMTNEKTNNIDIARLASVPHGNSILAMGQSDHYKGGAKEIPPLNGAIPAVSGLPIGRLPLERETDSYLAPYQHYIDNPFMGNAGSVPGFPGFSPADMNAILRFAHGSGDDVEWTTQLSVDSTIERGGVSNIPFVEKQADAASMSSTYWIQQMKDDDMSGCRKGQPRFRLLYTQVVMLDFFAPRRDGLPGRAQWPHISINSLEKLSDDPDFEAPPLK